MRSIGLCLLAVASACTGQIDGGHRVYDEPSGPSLEGVEGPAVDACAAPRVDAPAKLIRLSKVELANSLAALGGVVGATSATALEPDVRLSGFSNNADQKASAAFVDTLHRIAEPIARDVVAKAAGSFNSCAPGAAKAAPCARAFLSTFATAAYRRPVAADEVDDLLELYALGRDVETTATDAQRLTQGLEWAVRAILQSPNFVYRTELGSATPGTQTLTAHEVASALSYAVLAKPPDAALLAAAAANALETGDQRLEQVRRLKTQDPVAFRARQRRFALEWAEIDLNASAWSKQTAVYPQFNRALKDAIAQETDATIDAWVEQGSQLREWFGSQTAFINKNNASLYGLTSTSDDFVATPILWQKRRGVLTLPGFLGTHSDPDSSSPVLRGSTILRRFLCVNLPNVPVNVPPLPPKNESTAKTTRERFANHTANATCAACHGFIDPPGLTLENFDALGVFRTEENGVPVDAAGAFVATPSSDQLLMGPEALADALLGSADAERCVATQALRALHGRKEVDAVDACTIQQAANALHASGSVWGLFETLIADDRFATRSFGATP